MAPPNLKTPGVYVEEISARVKAIEGVETGRTAFLGQTSQGDYYRAISLPSLAGYEKNFGTLETECEVAYAANQFFVNGGEKLWLVRVPAATTPEQWQQALAALDEVDLLNLLALPGVTDPAVIKQAHDYAVKRRAFLLIDSPAAAVTPTDALAFRQSLASAVAVNAALYFPWVNVNGPLSPASNRLCAPSGSVAGVIVKTEAARGIWKAPAGTEAVLNGVMGLAVRLNDAQNGQLNPQAVNCLRLFPKAPVIWGSRTLAGNDDMASDWKYLSVRRLGLYIEESLDRGLQWATFEPNDEKLWAAIRQNAGDFLNGLFRQGAFQGTKPTDAYFVTCDASTTPALEVLLGVCHVLIGFAPLKPAEFIVLTLSLKITTG